MGETISCYGTAKIRSMKTALALSQAIRFEAWTNYIIFTFRKIKNFVWVGCFSKIKFDLKGVSTQVQCKRTVIVEQHKANSKQLKNN